MNKETIKNLIESRGIKATLVTVDKNGIKMDGISIGNENVRPTIYFKSFDEKFATDEEIAETMISIYEEEKEKNTMERFANVADNIKNFELCKDKIEYFISSNKPDESIKYYYDEKSKLYRGFRIRIDENATVKVTNQIYNCWCEENLELDVVSTMAESAINNLTNNLTVRNMSEVLSEITGEPEEKFTTEQELYILSNKKVLMVLIY